MSDDQPMRLTILGAGQLGGSFALALKEAKSDIVITAYDAKPAHAEALLVRGAIDHVAATPADAVKDADVTLFAAPLGSYRALAQAIAATLPNKSIVTDLGSVKRSMEQLAHLLPQAQLVPGHPIAGSEKSGPEAARGELFIKRLAILTPLEASDAEAVSIVETLWHAAGADVIHMPVPVHDQIYAYVSHLPHFIAFVAASYLHRIGAHVTADEKTLQQFLRISRSNPRMWTDIALENREALLPVLGTYIALLEHFATELRAGEKTDGADTVALAKQLLPRILAASLISSVSLHEQQSGLDLRPFGAGGMRDIVAPAAVTPEADTESISHHASVIADHIEAIVKDFRSLESLIGAEDGAGLYARVTDMVADADMLVSPRN